MASANQGTIRVEAINLPRESVEDRHILTAAQIDESKLKHVHTLKTNFGFDASGTPTTKTVILHKAGSAGKITGCRALLFNSGTTTAIAFDVQVNGVSILSATIDLVHGTGDKVAVAGALAVNPTSIAADDLVTAIMTVTSNTGALGPFLEVNLVENTAP
jgi:hypothetical protein